MEGRIVKAALEEMIARELSWRNDLFRLWSALLATNDWNTQAVERMVERRRGEATLHERQIDRKIGPKRTKIEPKSSQNRAEIDQKSLRELSGRSWAIRGPSGTPPGRSGTRPGSSRDAPGALRNAPGTVPRRSETFPGRSGTCPRHVGTSNERPRPRENGKNMKIVFSSRRKFPLETHIFEGHRGRRTSSEIAPATCSSAPPPPPNDQASAV